MSYEQAMETLQRICEKLNVAAEYLVPRLARMKIAENGIQIIFGLAILIVMLKLLKWAGKEAIERNFTDSWHDWPWIVTAASGFMALVSALCIIVCTAELASWIAAPEVMAIEYIVKMVK